MRKLLTPLISLALTLNSCSLKNPQPQNKTYNLTESIVERISNPHDAFSYLQKRISYAIDPYHNDKIPDDWRSLEWTLTHGLGDCDDFAIASAALLQDDGYPPKILFLGGNPFGFGSKHAVHLIEKDGEYGSIGVSEEDTQTIKRFPTVEELIKSWHPERIFNRYAVIDLSEVRNLDFTHDKENLWPKIVKPLLPLKWEFLEN